MKSAELGGLVPLPFVAVAVTVCGPMVTGLPGQDQFPFGSATVVQVGTPSIEVFTVDPGSDVPEITGGLLLLVDPFDGLEMTGAGGRCVTVKVTGPEAGLGMPCSRATAVAECAPSESAVGTGQDHRPPVTVAVQTTCPSIETTT